MSLSPTPCTLQVSLRECRLVFERLMQVIRMEPGMVPALRDCALYSAALGLGGFGELQRHLKLLESSAARALALTHDGAVKRLDCAGQHAWRVADTALDVLADDFKRDGQAQLLVVDVLEPRELQVIVALAERYGLSIHLEPHAEGLSLTASNRVSPAPAWLDRLRLEGLSVDATLWWQLFHHANEALAPDSFESRRHAGSIMVDADGRLVGRPDEDETDLSLLMAGIESGTTAPTP
ncbi:hypothetical protein IAE37_004875 [Pseudomonas sp. S31]|uniref:hypothetical protein n=1 Tax=Pseudomonas sp. S31 TaxID=1564473 RepID=UPI001912AE1F|nr:hypothetical protein [Pseudomonas sp. S31]MBK5002599.1 hypothetical protein [Pseudomonas sp. S31]